VDVVIPLAAIVDLEAEQKRIEQERKQLKEAAARLEEHLSNEQFLAKAPPHVVDAEKQRLATLKDKLERLGS
jgi:valyl-tRNA synthetase